MSSRGNMKPDRPISSKATVLNTTRRESVDASSSTYQSPTTYLGIPPTAVGGCFKFNLFALPVDTFGKANVSRFFMDFPTDRMNPTQATNFDRREGRTWILHRLPSVV